MTRGRFLAWAAVGAAAVAAVMMKDVGGLLADIQSAGTRSYGPGTFTGVHLTFWDTTELREAISLWGQSPAAPRLLWSHVVVDAVLFVPAFAAIVRALLGAVGTKPAVATALAWAYLVVDEVETVLTALVLPGRDLEVTGGFPLALLQLLATIKWGVLLVVAVTLVGCWRRPDEGLSWTGFAGALSQARSGGTQAPALALSGVIVIVGLFTALVALPAGGALDQLPDVIRHHFADGSASLWALSTLGFLLFFAAIAVAGLAATSPRGATATGATVSTRTVLLAATAVSATLWVAGGIVDGEWGRPVPWASIIVLGTLAFVAWVGAVACVGAPAAVSVAAPEAEPQPTWTPLSVAWVGGLAGAAAVVASIGMVRAAFPPLVLEVPDGRFPWEAATVLGVLGALLSGAAAQWLVVRLVDALAPAVHRVAAAVTVGAVAIAAALLAASPSKAGAWGSTGVVGVGFAMWTLVVGLLIWLSRTRPRWDVTRRLGFGARTPWLTLLVVTWIVASMLNSDGGYHDARVLEAGADAHRYASLDDAFTRWAAATETECAPAPGEPVPMVFVAAPGGGIRGAYWTVSVLDSLFPLGADGCASTRLFAISGVSGGSVGAATWVTAAGVERSPKDAVVAMSRDEPLPRALAGLLLRDLPQPLLGITTGWEDRAALFEQGWEDVAGVFGSSARPTPFAQAGAGDGLGFVPLVAFNGSSVTDACRVLVTNVARLPATLGPDCQAPPGPGSRAQGPVSGSIDPFEGLHPRDAGEAEECTGRPSDVPITTGALLSARFPLVTPTGAILRCVSGEETTSYVVDGGYYENSGLLTLLQMWSGLRDAVRQQQAGDGPLAGSSIEPWFVVVDNHYRAAARQVTPGRPKELPAMLQAKLQTVLTQPMLEQMAQWEMRDGTVPRFVRIAPAVNPGVEAPLGWVLSSPSRTNLDVQLDAVLEGAADNENLADLLEVLGISS